MKNRQLGFVDRKNGGLYLTSDKKRLTNNLLDINPVSTDILNAFTSTFNIQVDSSATVESVIKDNLSALLEN